MSSVRAPVASDTTNSRPPSTRYERTRTCSAQPPQPTVRLQRFVGPPDRASSPPATRSQNAPNQTVRRRSRRRQSQPRRDSRLETRGGPHRRDSGSQAAPSKPEAACGSWICLTPSVSGFAAATSPSGGGIGLRGRNLRGGIGSGLGSCQYLGVSLTTMPRVRACSSQGGPWIGGRSSLRRWGGESGSIRKPWPWITTWWWNQHTVVRFSGSVRPPSIHLVM